MHICTHLLPACLPAAWLPHHHHHCTCTIAFALPHTCFGCLYTALPACMPLHGLPATVIFPLHAFLPACHPPFVCDVLPFAFAYLFTAATMGLTHTHLCTTFATLHTCVFTTVCSLLPALCTFYTHTYIGCDIVPTCLHGCHPLGLHTPHTHTFCIVFVYTFYSHTCHE